MYKHALRNPRCECARPSAPAAGPALAGTRHAMDATQYSRLRIDTPHHEKTEEFGGPGGGVNINDPDFQQSSHNPYEPCTESRVRTPGAPQGTVITGETSAPFPGCDYDVSRQWWLYVPAQYEKSQAANLMMCFDGGGYVSEDGFNVPLVLDNLIHAKQIPVTICVFLTPGNTDSYSEQRSLEYDTVSDVNADFVLRTILPRVEARYNISDDPAKRCVCGLSSGGIAAFSAAWFRPESFGCVISWIGCKLTRLL